MKTDFLGNELNIGDEVVFMQLSYRSLMRGKITRISDTKVKIEHERLGNGRTECMQLQKQVVKV